MICTAPFAAAGFVLIANIRFARAARLRGARHVISVDISAHMLEEARRGADDSAITYIRASIEDFKAAEAFDLVVWSLALLHADMPTLCAGIVRPHPSSQLISLIQDISCQTMGYIMVTTVLRHDGLGQQRAVFSLDTSI